MTRRSIKVLVVLESRVANCSGPGTIKALNMSAIDCTVHAAAPDPGYGPLYLGDRVAVCPDAGGDDFFAWLVDYCRENRIDVVLCDASDFIGIAARRAELERASGARILVQPEAVIAIAEDKLRTGRWLGQNGFAHPAFAPGDDVEAVATLVRDHGYPLIAKPYVGRSSSGMTILRNDDDLSRATQRPDTLIQQHVGTDDTEYTVNCFVDRDGEVRGLFSFRRRLWMGMSVHCVVDRNESVLALAEAIAVAIGARGSTNVQLRLHEGAAVCLEINARFSGTTAMRASLGYNDLEHAFAHFVFDEPATSLPVITEGVALRYVEEIYPDMLVE